MPAQLQPGDYNYVENANRSVVCPQGASPFAGTSTQSLFASAQSNNVLFLCLGDSLAVNHNGDFDLSGDPQPVSAPGISYVFYSCPPSVSGPDWNSVLSDPCHIDPPAVNAVQSGVTIDGNATFFNAGQVQNVFNGGAPMQVFFAPITLDDFASFGVEEDPNTMELGPCINVNTSDAFSVTYLNQIEGLNLNNNAAGNCTGSFVVEGGLPEFDPNETYTISVSLNLDPTITGDLTGGNYNHGDIVAFTVPQPGIYNVLVEDGVSCAASFTIDMTACDAVNFIAGDEIGPNGSIVCVPISVQDFTDVLSFQYSVEWDPTILEFSSVNATGSLADLNFGPAPPIVDVATVSWFDVSFMGIDLPDNTVIYELCFTVIGPPGSSSPITFSGTPTEMEAVNSAQQELGLVSNAGSVTVTGNINLTFTSCSSSSSSPVDAGTFSITASGSAAPYTYNWENIADPTINGSGTITNNGDTDTAGDNMPVGDVGLPPGSYSVTVTDAAGGMEVANVEVFDAPTLFISLDDVDPTCPNSADGEIFIDNLPLGGVTPHTILWSTTDMNVTQITGLVAGSYSITVIDAAGCTRSLLNYGIGVSPIIVTATALNHVTCNGNGADGSIVVEATGGNIAPGSDYGYSWSVNSNGPSVNGLPPGNFCVTVTDDNNCEQIECFTINPPEVPTITSWDSISVACPTDMNGSLTVNVQPANSPIDSYTWDPPFVGADETISNIGPGTYYVTITAEDGCSVVDSATLFAPTPLVLDSFQITPPNCPGDNNGQIIIFASGGTEPYEYAWSTGVTTNDQVLFGLDGEMNYTVTITDSGNCGDEVIETIFLPDPPSIEVTLTNLEPVTCNGGVPCDGSAVAIASGGTAGTGVYNYSWSSGETEIGVVQSEAMQLCQGEFMVTVTDGLCFAIVSDEIQAPTALELDIDNTFSTQVSCFGDSDGAATVQALGGMPGYTYQWINPNVTGPTISDVPAGTYSGIITDANDCTFAFNIEVGEPEILVADINFDNTFDASCNGEEDGQIEVFWSGGNPGPATYTWTGNVSTTNIASDLPAGVYTVTVTDQNNCSDEVTYAISEPEPIIFELNEIPEPACFGFQTFITIDTAYGGGLDGFNPPYQFSVNGSSTQQITGSIPVLAGDHTVMVFDSARCSASLDITINQPPPIIVELGPDITLELGDSVELEPVIGSSLPLDSIIWNPLTDLLCTSFDCSEVLVKPFEDILYTVTVRDTNGCVGSDDVLIEIDKNRNVYIPNIFTPDGDGNNDFFQVFVGRGVQQVNFLQVYDRWGEQVHEARNFIPGDFDIEYGWDGTFKGKRMDSGVYVYIAEVTFVDGLTLLYRGDVTLMY